MYLVIKRRNLYGLVSIQLKVERDSEMPEAERYNALVQRVCGYMAKDRILIKRKER